MSKGNCRVTSNDLYRNRAAADLAPPDIGKSTIANGAVAEHDEATDPRIPRWEYAIGAAYLVKCE